MTDERNPGKSGESSPGAHKWDAMLLSGGSIDSGYYKSVRYCSVCGMEDTCEDPLPPCPGSDSPGAGVQPTELLEQENARLLTKVSELSGELGRRDAEVEKLRAQLAESQAERQRNLTALSAAIHTLQAMVDERDKRLAEALAALREVDATLCECRYSSDHARGKTCNCDIHASHRIISAVLAQEGKEQG